MPRDTQAANDQGYRLLACRSDSSLVGGRFEHGSPGLLLERMKKCQQSGCCHLVERAPVVKAAGGGRSVEGSVRADNHGRDRGGAVCEAPTERVFDHRIAKTSIR